MDLLLVVLYKQLPEESETISTFIKDCSRWHNKIKLVIWDNSPNNVSDNLLPELPIPIEYIHTPENISLAKIYNNTISKYKTFRAVYIFDQDSVVTDLYFAEMNKYLSLYSDIGLFAPKIYHNSILLSPAIEKYNRTQLLKSIDCGIHSTAGLRLIMSGLCVRPTILNTIKFDENLRLYWIDNVFSYDYSLKYKTYCVINYTLSHQLSCFDKDTIKNKWRRSIINAKGAIYASNKRSLVSKIYTRLYISAYLLKNFCQLSIKKISAD